MPISNDLNDLESQVKKSKISAASFLGRGSFASGQEIANIHKTIGNLAGHVRKTVIRVGALEKILANQSKKITSLKNISGLQGQQIRGTNIGAKLPGGSADNLDKTISTIAETVSSIAETLKAQKKASGAASENERKKAEREKRGLAESKLEKAFGGIINAAQKIIAPVKSIIDRILDFIKTVILGRIIYKLVGWLGDPKNTSKVKSIIRFVKDWWPTLLGAYIIFGTSFGRFTTKIIGMVARFAVQIATKAIPGLITLARRNPATAALALGTTTYLTNQALNPSNEQPTQQMAGGGYVRPRRFRGGGLASLRRFFGLDGGGYPGYVSGQKGVDKIPAMLSDGEFVMSRGAVQMYGADTLAAMNAAGGGTNRPKIMGGTTYAQGGGPMGRMPNPDPAYENTDTRINLTKELEKYAYQAASGGNALLVKALNFLTSTLKGQGAGSSSGGGGTAASGGGGTGAFLRGIGFAGRSAREVPRVLGNAVNPALSYGQRVIGEGQKMVAPTVARAGRVANEVRKKVEPVVKGIPGFIDKTISGLKPVTGAASAAATEAIPAVLNSILGRSVTDTNISEDMQRQILQAQKTAAKKGRNFVEYEDYEGGGRFSGAGLTMGRIGDREFKRDAKGRIIGLRQVYDTDTTVKKAMDAAGADWRKFGSSINLFKGKFDPNFKALMGGIYKPVEALLAASQGRGKTLHDINFDEKVLGFKPGKEVLNQTQKNMIAAQKNREALQDKRPWWDKMGLFGGASAEMKRKAEEESKRAAQSGQYGRYAPGSQQAQLAKPKPKTLPVKPPVRTTTVMQGQTAVTMYSKNDSRRKSSGPTTPKFSARPSSSSKHKILGLTLPF